MQIRIAFVCLFFFGFCFGTTSGNIENTEKLYELAAKGELSEELVSEFYQYALKNAKEKIPASDEFWDWLAENKEVQKGLLVGLHPDYNPDVIKHLRELRETFGTQVEQYPHLTLAFSFAYGAAKGKTIKSPWLHWTARDRPVPSCCESFAYYLENKEKMIFPLGQLPWPLMLYVADNDIPLSERQWVLSRYNDFSISKLSRLHTAPPYVTGTHANSLPAIRKEGGVCYKQAYYASRVMKCLGVPSYKIHVPEHIYEGWVVDDGELTVKIGGAYGYSNGSFFCPLTRTKPKQYEFKLLVSAINLSYTRYLKSHIACHIFKMLPDASKKEAITLLEVAIKNNPYVAESWFEYARACETGLLPLETGWKLFDRARGILPDSPELECIILNKLTTAQLKNNEAIPENQYEQTRNNFKETFKGLHEKNRVDLAGSIFITHASYLAKTKGIHEVVDNSLMWFKLKKFKIDDEKRLFRNVHNLVIESKDTELLEKLLETEYQRRKLLTRKSSEKLYPKHYSCYAQVANAYIAYYNKGGNHVKASQIAIEMDQLKKENFNLNDLPDIVMQGRPVGAIEEQVTIIKPVTQGCIVWRILYPLPKSVKVRIRLQHAAAGNEGAFHLTAWSDNDRNGVPDTQIAISPLLVAKTKDQWSQWEFVPTDRTIFVGLASKVKIPLYYQMKGELEGYYGLSNRLFYTRAFDGTPQLTAHPRYTNMQVEILRR